MIGLALSMGGASLLLPRQNDGAIAAEPQPTDTVAVDRDVQAASASSTLTTQPEQVVVPSVPATVDRVVVQPGQTLWQLARQFKVDAHTIARVNGLPANAVLRVGQTIAIPSATAAPVRAVTAAASPAPAVPQAAVSEPLSTELSDDVIADSSLKAEQDAALEQMRQKREKLRAGLSELQPEPAPLAIETSKQPEAADSVAVEPSPSVTELPANAPVELPQVPQATVPATDGVSLTHQVKPGDTLDAIASTYDVSRQALVAVNQLSDPNWLRVNQSIVIPQAEAETAPLPVSPQPESSAEGAVYRVNPGDTVVEIASRYNIPQSTLIAANGIANPNLIVVNQELTIPALDPAALLPEESIAAVPPAEAVEPTQATLPTVSTPAATAPEVAAVPPALAEKEQTAAAPAEAAVASRPQPDSRQYVEGLMAEILSMRDRYQQTDSAEPLAAAEPQRIAAVSPTPAVVEELDSPVNPQFRPNRMAPAVEPVQEPTVAPEEPEAAAQPNQPDAEPDSSRQLVAAAPLGSENYAPLIQPIAGQMVSPDLPPLPAADAYLPEGAPVFDGYLWPARGVLTSGYGWRWGRMHRGIDIGAPTGTPVVAAAAGEVVFAGWNSGGYGNLVDIRHADGSLTRYAHNSRLLVRRGQQVEQGELISEVGSTGYSTGPHLHFEIHLPNRGTVNPIALLPRARN